MSYNIHEEIDRLNFICVYFAERYPDEMKKALNVYKDKPKPDYEDSFMGTDE